MTDEAIKYATDPLTDEISLTLLEEWLISEGATQEQAEETVWQWGRANDIF